MAWSVKPNMEIKINEELYALDKIPSENSDIVQAERDKLLAAIDLKAIITCNCDLSPLSVAKIKRDSSSILTNLQSAYGQLLNNESSGALETLSSIQDLTSKMEKMALELHHDFTTEAKFTRGDTQLENAKMQAALFWEQIRGWCLTLADVVSKMQSNVETAMTRFSKENQLKVWTSKAFKLKALFLLGCT